MNFIYTLIVIPFMMLTSNERIFDFSKEQSISSWRIVNDGVMGGVSKSSLTLTEEGYGKFSGHVSLANNGGFASIQLPTKCTLDSLNKHIVLRLKGDGKNYEFRLKGKSSQSESYVHPFTTSGEWETISLPIIDFYPQFRGRKLTLPNFNFKRIEQISFLIANSKEEDFELLIDWIGLE